MNKTKNQLGFIHRFYAPKTGPLASTLQHSRPSPQRGASHTLFATRGAFPYNKLNEKQSNSI